MGSEITVLVPQETTRITAVADQTTEVVSSVPVFPEAAGAPGASEPKGAESLNTLADAVWQTPVVGLGNIAAEDQPGPSGTNFAWSVYRRLRWMLPTALTTVPARNKGKIASEKLE